MFGGGGWNVERGGLDPHEPYVAEHLGLRRVMRRQRLEGVVMMGDAVDEGVGGLML